jgi:rhodanese-related sulfurtransferase
MNTISIEELDGLLKKDAKIQRIDVRSQSEFKAEHIDGFVNVPLNVVDSVKLTMEDPVIVICQHGIRSKKAAEILANLGYNVMHVAGGVSQWKTKFTTIKGEKQPISIFRQVQILVGFFIVLSALLALTISVNFVVIGLFLGIGLFISGVTNTCALGRLLGWLPWNK